MDYEEIEDVYSEEETDFQELQSGETTQDNVDSVLDLNDNSSSDDLTIDQANELLSLMNEVLRNEISSNEASSEVSLEGDSDDLISPDFVDYSSYLSSIEDDLVLSNEYASLFLSSYSDYEANNNLHSNVNDISLSNALILVTICVLLLSCLIHFIRSIF